MRPSGKVSAVAMVWAQSASAFQSGNPGHVDSMWIGYIQPSLVSSPRLPMWTTLPVSRALIQFSPMLLDQISRLALTVPSASAVNCGK